MVEVVTATDDDVARFYGGIQFSGKWMARAMRRGRLVSGIGGLIEIEPGTWAGFIEVPAHERRPSLYRHAKQMINEAKAEGATTIKTWCDESIPRAREMMQRMGFTPTDETADGIRIWSWVS